MIAKVIARLIIIALSVLAAAYLVPDFHVAGFYPAILTAILLGILNLLFKPLLILLTLPLNILTLGLFSIIINAFLLWLAGTIIQGLNIGGFIPSILGSLIISFGGWIANKFVR